MVFNPVPKPINRSTAKAKRDRSKAANIGDVRAEVVERDELCRLVKLLNRFGLSPVFVMPPELAHVDARGMGGNPDLSRDTTENTFLLTKHLHTGPRSHHSGHVKVRALTGKGMDGPVCFELYEELPTVVEALGVRNAAQGRESLPNFSGGAA